MAFVTSRVQIASSGLGAVFAGRWLLRPAEPSPRTASKHAAGGARTRAIVDPVADGLLVEFDDASDVRNGQEQVVQPRSVRGGASRRDGLVVEDHLVALDPRMTPKSSCARRFVQAS